MRIACAACNAVYELSADRLRPGTAVRCIRCKTVWVPVEREDAGPAMPVAPEPFPPFAPLAPTEPEPAAPVPAPFPPEPAMEPVSAPAQPPAPPLRRREGTRLRAWPVAAAWAASILVLAGLGAAALAYRPAVVAAWPPSERAYRLLGLP